MRFHGYAAKCQTHHSTVCSDKLHTHKNNIQPNDFYKPDGGYDSVNYYASINM